MGLINFLLISAKILLSCSFWIVCRPSVTLLCPLYASIRAIESDKASSYQKCLQYWVLFGLTTVLELTLAKPLTGWNCILCYSSETLFAKEISCLLSGFSFWLYAKGLASLLLVMPQFSVASYVYMHFVKPRVSPNPRAEKVTENNDCMPMKISDNIDAAPIHVEQKEKDNLQSLVIYEVESSPTSDRPIYPKKVQMDWSCALCLVSTSSEKCLKQHIQGRKHKLKEEEEEERKHEMMASRKAKFASKLEGSYLTDLLKSLNRLKSEKFVELRGLNFPMRRPVKRCTWKKPEFGWIKLNTDGSIKNSGLGCLLRDDKGAPLCACISKVPCDDIFLVELLAIWRGLTLAASIGIKMIWVESDSMSAVKAINKEQPYSQKASSCLIRIWKILNKFQKYQVTHSFRETNRAADYLSKMDISGSDIVIWPRDFSSSLCKFIAEDAQGSWYLRR